MTPSSTGETKGLDTRWRESGIKSPASFFAANTILHLSINGENTMTTQTTQTTKAPSKAKSAAVKATQKPASATAAKAKGIKLYIPKNRPTAGGTMFAYTAAAMQIVMALPEAKRLAAAKVLHGLTAIRHHTTSTGRMKADEAKGILTYDQGFFAVGPKSTDAKRAKVPTAWADAFIEYIKTGGIKKAPDGFTWKPSHLAPDLVEVRA